MVADYSVAGGSSGGAVDLDWNATLGLPSNLTAVFDWEPQPTWDQLSVHAYPYIEDDWVTFPLAAPGDEVTLQLEAGRNVRESLRLVFSPQSSTYPVSVAVDAPVEISVRVAYPCLE